MQHRPTFADALKAQLIESARASGIKAPAPNADALALAKSLHEDEHTAGAERADCDAMLRAFGVEVPR